MSLKLREGRYYKCERGLIYGPMYPESTTNGSWWRAPGTFHKWAYDGTSRSNKGTYRFVEEVVVTPAPKPVSGSVVIVRRDHSSCDNPASVYHALICKDHEVSSVLGYFDETVVARLDWTEGDGMGHIHTDRHGLVGVRTNPTFARRE